jgi:sterol desaturase/sphingolipid hydroxylase (fatty acid hydroxylase superfamily)
LDIGCNRGYIDKNYGAILIIWDRIFGTFEEEKEDVVFGVTTQVRSFNIWHIQVREKIG